MASEAGTLEVLARELAHALQPLEQRLAAGSVDGLFSSLGLRLPSGFTGQAALTAPLSAGVSAAAALPPLLVQLTAAIEAEDIGQIVSSGQALLEKITAVIEAIPQISSGLDSVAAGFGGLTPAQRAEINTFAEELPRRLLDLLVVEYIESRTPSGIPPTLALLGIIDTEVDPGVPEEPLRPPFVRKVLHLERVPKLFSDPDAFMLDVYGWGDPAFDGLKLLGNLHRFVEEFLEAPVDLLAPPGFPAILEAYLYAVRVNPATTPPGVVVDFRFPATQDFERTYPLTAPWALKVTAKARFDPDLEVTITPPLDASLRPRQGTVNIDFTAGVAADSTTDPILLLGQSGGTRLQAKQVSVSAGFAASFDGATARGEPLGIIAVTGGALVIDTSDGDGFIQSLLSGAKVNSAFDVKARWRPSTGIVFEGGAGIELVIPTHLNLGPVEIQQLYLRFAFTDEVPLRLEAALALGATIGPLSVSVDRIGAAGNFTFPPDRDGNLGVADLDLDFLPPTGLGVVVDAGPIAGGGFLSFEPETGRYAGILQLEAMGLALTAVGLLDTRMPDGSSGFSFLIIVSVDLPPIQLGFGFTLNGVGGLAGIHRTVITEVLRQGLIHGTLDHIMFPRDPVRNAPQIISDLRAVFPPMMGRFVFGPMLKLGWGVPSLIIANIGVVLELPDPFRILILGQAKVEIPAPDAAIVSLKLAVLGVIDFEERLFSIDATLYDSRVATFSVYGDMAMRLFWGEPPNFALAIGGLHPQFRPPPNFPTLRRATIEIGLGGNPRLTCQSYLAVTSNSLQTGAKIELYASAGSFNIHGWLGFDALLIVRPLSFQVDIDAGVELRRNTSVIAGIHVHATLSGLGPWHVKGKACLSLFFFDICVPFQLTIGSALDQVLPSINPLLQLVAALEDPRSWVSGLPPSAFRAVSFATLPGSTLTLIDPVGSLSVQQKVLPLNRTLTKFGEAALLGADRYDLTAVRIGTNGVAFTLMRDFFAAGQFQKLTDAEKLSRDAYEKMDAGVTIAANTVTNGTGRAVPVEYETIIIDAPEGFEAPFTKFVKRNAGVFSLSATSLLARSERVYSAHLTANNRTPYVAPAGTKTQVTLGDELFVVASTANLSMRTDLGAPDSKGAVHDALARHLAAHPEERGQWQVVPVDEAEVPA
jgi:Family of unknown function (DUF6603)